MAAFFGSPPFVYHPLTRTPHFSSSQTPPPPPPPTPPSQPQSPTPPLSITSSEPPAAASVKGQQQKPTKPATPVTTADSTDWIASTLTRRFGLGAGLAWAAFLALGVVSEQIKTRLEVSQQEANTRDVEKEEEVVLPNGIRYYEMRVGGGASPRPGDLVVIDLKGSVQGSGEVFVDTFDGEKKPLALKSDNSSSLGFGEKGADLGSGLQIPPSATLEYIVEVDKVSIAPA
ncbi:Peptidyl-prolyl cis-trans isomerase FKBP17-2, chloroplastic [Vitis vinifera]|uniref:Peptidyl-prolyl cis-trans isomerase FKBP17-2, chloroplastic n=1 Tax=Vitis vinifera TaxID=29760 RepID=A0A438C2G2_VITVI|nr:Peptidyl-prolyl cis-trans isomerase FKBP17-2, chloroplastic [Vitis vinifera]